MNTFCGKSACTRPPNPLLRKVSAVLKVAKSLRIPGLAQDTCPPIFITRLPSTLHTQKSRHWHTTIVFQPCRVPNAIYPQRTINTQHSPSYHNRFSPAQGIPRLYRNPTSVTTLTKPCLRALSRATLIQSTSPYDVFTIHFNIIPLYMIKHPKLYFPFTFFPLLKIPHIFRWPCFLHVPPISSSVVS